MSRKGRPGSRGLNLHQSLHGVLLGKRVSLPVNGVHGIPTNTSISCIIANLNRAATIITTNPTSAGRRGTWPLVVV